MVGVALIAIVFSGIFGAYRFGLEVVLLSRNKITAMSIANSKLEAARALSYEQIGVPGAVLPGAEGILAPETVETVGGAVYNIKTAVKYISDPADGSGADDDCNLDYKKMEVAVSWGGKLAGEIFLSTIFAPKNLIQELQSCMSQPGGVLEVKIFDDFGIAVPSPTITVRDPATGNIVDTATPTIGIHVFPLSEGSYRVEATKNDYSSARTYSAVEVAVPDSPDPSVFDSGLTPVSLSIGSAAAFSIDAISPEGQDNFSDSFADGALISEINGVQISSGGLTLAGPPYEASGSAVSVIIAPTDIAAWDMFVFSDTILPDTEIIYQLLYNDGVEWRPIPDNDLGGNIAGFTDSPIDISGLDKNIYTEIKIRGVLSSSDIGATPRVDGWQIFWTTGAGPAIAAAKVRLIGAKTIGKDAFGQAVRKYDQDLIMDGAGHLNIMGIDSDAYTFRADPADGFDLIATDRDPQPITAGGGENTAVKIFLRVQNSFLILVQDDESLAPVFSASVRIHSAPLGYDKTQYTDSKGQSYFAPLQNGIYNVEISAPGYLDYSAAESVFGQTFLAVGVDRQE